MGLVYGLPVLGLLTACAAGARPLAVEAPPQRPAPDAAADTLLVELAAVIPGLRLEVRYAGPDNFTGAPLPGYEAPRVFLRREAAAALARVQAALAADGLGLKVFDGYRPVRASEGMVAWAERTGRTRLLDDGYIARRSRHNQGVAVDLTLVRLADGQELDMGTAYDVFTSAAHTANATGVTAANRQRLVRAMAAAGFANYAQEWWHFTIAVPDAVSFDRVIR